MLSESRTEHLDLGSKALGPDFVCIGPKKTATTWVADHLKLNLDIWLPPIKELSYLQTGNLLWALQNEDKLRLSWNWWEITKRILRNRSLSARTDRAFYARIQKLAEAKYFDLDLYRDLFAPARTRITGDISPMYASMTVEQIRRAAPVLDGAQVFMIARDPIKRFWSELAMHYRMQTRGSVDYGSLEVAKSFFEEPARQQQHLLSGIVERWRTGLANDRLRIFFFDNIVARPEKSLREITAYVGAAYGKRLPLLPPRYNRKQGNTKMTVALEAREWIRLAFQQELRACAELFPHYGERWLRQHSRRLTD